MEINKFHFIGGTVVEQVWGRGTLICQKYMCRFEGPFFQAAPETHIFTPSVSYYAIRVRFSKNSAFLGPFLSNFGKISAPNWTH